MDIVVFTENIVKAIAKEADMVSVQKFEGDEEAIILEIMVHESDMGTVIGKGGKMASAIRTLVQAYAYINDNKKVRINIDSF